MSASSAAGTLKEDLSRLSAAELVEILGHWPLWARQQQLPPPATQAGEPWRVWLIMGGRGAGKTRAGAEWVRAKALGLAPLGAVAARRIALLGETISEVRRVMVEGASGLLSVHRGRERPHFEPSKRQLVWPSGAIAQADLPLVLEGHLADGIAEAWLFETWAQRERASFTLPPSRLALEPSDVVALDANGDSLLLRITEVGEHGAREISARAIDPDVYGGVGASERPVRLGEPVLSGQPLVAFLDLPLLRGDEPPEAGFVAATQTPWPGGIAVYASPETTGYTLKGLAEAPATMGTTLDDLPEGPAGRFDYGAKIRVAIEGEALASITELQVFAGGNVAAVRNEDGEWEVLQFKSAALTAPGTYEISELLRGQGGTEFAMRPAVAAGATFVLLNSAVVRVDLAAAEIRLPLSWRVGPSTRDIGDASYVASVHTFQGLGLKPLSPVHVRAERAGGDVAIDWVRRTRVGGDTWEAPEVPLGEDAESYEVDILDGASVVRTLTSATPAVTYTAAQQAADFGSAQPSYDVRIYQMSASYGRGTARAAAV